MQTIERPVEAPAAPSGDGLSSLVSAMLKFSRLARSWEALERAGMSKIQVAVLIELARTGAERVTTLANRLGIEISVISRQLAAMTDAGLVERLRDPEDGRACLVTLSAQGRELLVQLDERRHAWFSNILADFDDTELASAARLIETVNAAWETVQRAHS